MHSASYTSVRKPRAVSPDIRSLTVRDEPTDSASSAAVPAANFATRYPGDRRLRDLCLWNGRGVSAHSRCMTIMSNDAHTVELPTSECWALARSVPIGRIAVVVDGRPDIFPVNHVVDHGTIVVRTGAGTKLTAADRHHVAFEIDGYDAERAEAWSVVIKGVAKSAAQLHDVIDALQLPVVPWQSGPKPNFLRIEPDTITGRRIHVSGGYSATPGNS